MIRIIPLASSLLVLLLSPLLLLLLFTNPAEAVTASLTESPAYESQRPCAKDCFYLGAWSGPDYLAENIGCDASDIQNECLCRPDLQPKGDSWLRSCVGDRCDKNTLDISVAVSIYDAYCTKAGFTTEPPAPTPTSSDANFSSSSSASSSQPQTIHKTSSSPVVSNSRQDSSSNTRADGGAGGQTPAPSSSGGSSSNDNDSNNGNDKNGGGGGDDGLNAGEIVGIVVGVLGFIATAVGTWFSYKAIKNKRAQPPPPPETHVYRGWD